MIGSLVSVAFQILWSGFRPSTLTAYKRIFNTFLGFLVALNLWLSRICTCNIWLKMLCLLTTLFYPTAIRSLCIIYNCHTTPFQRLLLFIKSLKINRQFNPRLKLFIDENLLLNIVTVISQLQSPEVYQALYCTVLCYFHFSGFPIFCLMLLLVLI